LFLREVLREVFEKSAIIFFLNILNLNSGNVHFIQIHRVCVI